MLFHVCLMDGMTVGSGVEVRQDKRRWASLIRPWDKANSGTATTAKVRARSEVLSRGWSLFVSRG